MTECWLSQQQRADIMNHVGADSAWLIVRPNSHRQWTEANRVFGYEQVASHWMSPGSHQLKPEALMIMAPRRPRGAPMLKYNRQFLPTLALYTRYSDQSSVEQNNFLVEVYAFQSWGA